MHFDDEIVVPDLAGWRRERMPEYPDTAYFTLAPDLGVRGALRASTRKVDLHEKRPIYALAGGPRLTSVQAESLLRSAPAPEPFGPNWIIAANQPCQLHNPEPTPGEVVTWSGACVDAVKDAIQGWRRWWTHTGLFGGESRGEGIVRELVRAVWPTHWQETEEEDRRITEKLKAERDRERAREQRERNLSQYRPRLVETEPSRKSQKGTDQGNTGGWGIGS